MPKTSEIELTDCCACPEVGTFLLFMLKRGKFCSNSPADLGKNRSRSDKSIKFCMHIYIVHTIKIRCRPTLKNEMAAKEIKQN